MTEITVREACERLDDLLDEVSDSHEPVLISGSVNSAVLVGEGDWRAMQETLALCSCPGVRESIVEGMTAPVSECESGLDW